VAGEKATDAIGDIFIKQYPPHESSRKRRR
jgi:hypothetical protein